VRQSGVRAELARTSHCPYLYQIAHLKVKKKISTKNAKDRPAWRAETDKYEISKPFCEAVPAG
jgi:hypothetical protein